MEEDISDKIVGKELVECINCKKPVWIYLSPMLFDEELHMWHQGVCANCGELMVVPMPVLAEMSKENRRVLWRILSN